MSFMMSLTLTLEINSYQRTDMIAYDCNGKVLNISDIALKIKASDKNYFLVGKTVIIVGPLKFWEKGPIPETTMIIPDTGFCVEIKYCDGTAHNVHYNFSITDPCTLMKITPDSEVKHKEKEYVLNR
jgi:hypothetical protein